MREVSRQVSVDACTTSAGYDCYYELDYLPWYYHHSSCNVRGCCSKKLQRYGLIPQRPTTSTMFSIGNTSGFEVINMSAISN